MALVVEIALGSRIAMAAAPTTAIYESGWPAAFAWSRRRLTEARIAVVGSLSIEWRALLTASPIDEEPMWLHLR